MNSACVHIKVGGEAGFGIMASGLMLIKTFARGGLKAITINDYPSLIRGGHNVILVKIANQETYATDDCADILVCLNRETFDLHKTELNQNAVIIYDPESFSISETEISQNTKLVPVPLMKFAKVSGGDVLMRNTVALGAIVALLDYDLNLLKEVIKDQFKNKKPEITDINIKACELGFNQVKQELKFQHSSIGKELDDKKQLVLTGNEAIGLGAIRAGMKFFAAYPMTPINGLLYYLAGIAEKTGFVYKQPEDEIAGINMAIGASFAGIRSMVATSGGGFCLMSEGLSLAGMIEQPIVIIYGQRPGPATGLPTWTTQGDLHFVLNASQGEFPRLVLAPGDVVEAFTFTQQAFNLAEVYQTPVFVLVDKYLCESYFTVPYDTLNNLRISINRGKLMTEEEQEKDIEVKRYLLTDDGISPRPLPGRTRGVFHSNSDEHDEFGYSTEEAYLTRQMIEKRMKKLTTAQIEVPEPILYGDKKAKHTLVGWGSTKGPVLETLKQLNIQGKSNSVNYLHLNWINPFPGEQVEQILKNCRHAINIEGNYNSQMRDWILLKTGIKIKDTINKYDGRPFFPTEIISNLKKYL